MRLDALRLTACGPFTNAVLDLGGGQHGLHLIYGPNEAGKSSALRALTCLFFGFDAQTSDAFLHPYERLRVGARIRNDRGETLDFVRRKAGKNSLRAADDQTVLEEARLREFLGPVDRQRFTTFFGINHEALVEGGREIMAEQGEVGQALFSASGIRNLPRVLAQLQEDYEALYLPHGRKPKLNGLFSQLKEVRKKIKEYELRPSDWEVQHEALQDLLRKRDRVSAQLSQLNAERSCLQRHLEAVPLAAQLAEAVHQHAAVAQAVLLPEQFPEKRRNAQEQCRLQEAAARQAAEAIQRFRADLDKLASAPDILTAKGQIESLRDDLGAVRQAEKDAPNLEAEVRQHRQTVANMLRDLGSTLSVDRAHELCLPEAQRIHIQELAGQYEALRQEADRVEADRAETQTQLELLCRELEKLPPLADIHDLEHAIQAAIRQGDLEAELLEARIQLDNGQARLQAALRALPLWSGEEGLLETLPVPPQETIDRFEADLADADAHLRELARKIQEADDEQAEALRKLEALRLEQDVPSEADLQQTRSLRQRAWRALKQQWLDGKPPSSDVDDLLREGRAVDLLEAFERLVERADDVADRLRREAKRVQEKAHLQAQLERAKERLASLAAQREQTDAAKARLLEQWEALWSGCHLRPLPPREMRAWRQKHKEAVLLVQSVRETRSKVQTLQERLEQHCNLLAQALTAAGQPCEGGNSRSLTQWLGLAQKCVKAQQRAAQERENRERECHQLKAAHRKLTDSAQRAHQKLAKWEDDWNAATSRVPIFLPGLPGQAAAVLERLHKLKEELAEIAAKEERIRNMRTFIQRFAESVEQLAARVAPELNARDAEQTAAALVKLLQQHQANASTREHFERQLRAEEENLKKAQDQLAQQQALLRALCDQACCASPDKLPAAEERSATRRTLEAGIDRLKSQLRDLAAGRELEDFLAEVRAAQPDQLAQAIQEHDREITQLERELKQIHISIGRQEQIVASMDASARAVEAAEQARDIQRQICDEVEEYVRIRLAHAILRKGIDRIRHRHQQPILERASRFFARLTGGAFSGLAEDYGEHGESELVGKRNGSGQLVRVPQMSDGTADQLYLAVRLAWLCDYVERHESFPFIVDDVLICFDDQRAAAALRTLAELSSQMQVIFFTHHWHLVELAKRHVARDCLFVHELALPMPWEELAAAKANQRAWLT